MDSSSKNEAKIFKINYEEATACKKEYVLSVSAINAEDILKDLGVEDYSANPEKWGSKTELTKTSSEELETENDTIICGLLRDEYLFNLLSGPDISNSASCNENKCKENLLHTVKAPKEFKLDESLKRNNFMRGPTLKHKCLYLPRIMKRLADKKRSTFLDNATVKKKEVVFSDDNENPREFSYLSHIFKVKQVIEKYREFNEMVYIVFIDLEPENNQKMISPEMSIALQNIFKSTLWSDKGIRIGEKNLPHLLFEKTLILFATTQPMLYCMLDEIRNKFKLNKLSIDINKIEAISPAKSTHIKRAGLIDINIPIVPVRIYMGQVLALNDAQKLETKRRINLGNEIFQQMRQVFTRDSSVDVKRELFEKYILTVMTQGAETWKITKPQIKEFQKAQQEMEKIMLGITTAKKKSQKDLKEIRKLSGLTDIGVKICTMKWRWMYKLIRQEKMENYNTRSLLEILDWKPGDKRRPGGLPNRWITDIQKIVQIDMRNLSREEWCILEEIYVKNWASLTHLDNDLPQCDETESDLLKNKCT